MPHLFIRYLKQLSIAHRFYLGFLTIFVSFLIMGLIYGMNYFHTQNFFDEQITKSHTLKTNLVETTQVNTKTIHDFSTLETQAKDVGQLYNDLSTLRNIRNDLSTLNFKPSQQRKLERLMDDLIAWQNTPAGKHPFIAPYAGQFTILAELMRTNPNEDAVRDIALVIEDITGKIIEEALAFNEKTQHAMAGVKTNLSHLNTNLTRDTNELEESNQALLALHDANHTYTFYLGIAALVFILTLLLLLFAIRFIVVETLQMRSYLQTVIEDANHIDFRQKIKTVADTKDELDGIARVISSVFTNVEQTIIRICDIGHHAHNSAQSLQKTSQTLLGTIHAQESSIETMRKPIATLKQTLSESEGVSEQTRDVLKQNMGVMGHFMKDLEALHTDV